MVKTNCAVFAYVWFKWYDRIMWLHLMSIFIREMLTIQTCLKGNQTNFVGTLAVGKKKKLKCLNRKLQCQMTFEFKSANCATLSKSF